MKYLKKWIIIVVLCNLLVTSIKLNARIISSDDLAIAYKMALNSSFVCIGVEDSVEGKEGFLELSDGQTLKEGWIKYRISVNQILIGTEENKLIVVKTFVPQGDATEYPVIIPDKQKSMLFLSKDPHGDYVFTNNQAALIKLPSGLPDAKKTDNPAETIQQALALVIEDGGEQAARDAIPFFRQAFPDQTQLVKSLRQVAISVNDPSGYAEILSERLRLHDTTAFQEAFIWLAKNMDNGSAIVQVTSFLTDVNISVPPELAGSLLLSKEVRVRRNAISCLRNSMNRAAVPFLVNALDDTDSKVRKMTLLGLRQIINPQSPEFQKIKYTESDDGEIIAWWKKWWVDFGEKQFSLPTSGVVNPK